jgi:membrane protease YdiL (CAAX protease family)
LIHERYANFGSLLQLIEFLKGLVGGLMFIFSIHAVNAFLGCASFTWPHIPPSLDVMAWLKVCGQMSLLIVQGTVMASAISLVEELLFRSWLPQEIAVDLGYHYGIIISGLAFSFLQRFVYSLELCFSCVIHACIIHALHFGFYRTIYCIFYSSIPILLKYLIFCFSSVFLFILVRLLVLR